jgi:hypothetical protein
LVTVDSHLGRVIKADQKLLPALGRLPLNRAG